MRSTTQSGFTAERKKNHQGNDIYNGRIDKAVASMEKDELNGMSPAYAAQKVLSCAYARNPAPVRYIGRKYFLFSLLDRLLPKRFVNFLIGKLY